MFSLTKMLREPRTARGVCELCAEPLAAQREHGHVVDTTDRRLLCACQACRILFDVPGAARGRFKKLPKRCARVPAPLFSAAQWEALGIPIGLAFFFENGETHQLTAFYPGPAGATESLLPLEAWNELRTREPLLASLEPDVEAVLVHRPPDGDAQSFIVPIDVCYELTGLVRLRWSGINGGDAVREAIAGFVSRLQERAQ